MKDKIDTWQFSTEYRQICKIIETYSLWGETSCRIWLPSQNIVVRTKAESLIPLTEQTVHSSSFITYIVSAAKVADAITHDVLLAPIESKVIPLPHQIRALSKATSSERVRYLLADEVGLGKTIEAGLIMRELKLRGLVKRTLVVSPKGLATQWVAEMQTHFNEDFRLLIPGDFSIYRKFAGEKNLWRSCDQAVCPMDSVKPLDSRRGWSQQKVATYNRDRFDDLISAGWDLIIVDEAHRLGGSTDQVARFKLGQGLSEAAPYFLLLTATPHQGKTDAFHRILSLLDEDAFPDVNSVTRERVQPYVIRTEKRQAIDAEGMQLFLPRHTHLIPVRWEKRHIRQKLLYEAITEYVRQGYNQAIKLKRNYIGFLLILMQRLVASSTRAIKTTLERRLEVLESQREQLTLFPMQTGEDWEDLDGQEQLEVFIKSDFKALKNEKAEVRTLLEAARHCDASGKDAKAEALLGWLYKLQQQENDPDLKVLLFTEFVPTQEMLKEFLEERGFDVVCLNGSMGMEERQEAQDQFASDMHIMISTDAGGEGLNLQFCHVIINYDLPWNPMRIEQRIGRVDRIGQKHIVQAVNFVFEDTVDKYREVLEEKLAIIHEEFGIDKTGDVLDSAEAGQIFDRLYVGAILEPDKLDEKVDSALNNIQKSAEDSKKSISVFGVNEDLNPEEAKRLITHPLAHWIEKMTISYLKANGGKAEKNNGKWDITWPDGNTIQNAVFSFKEAADPTTRQLTLEDTQIRGIATSLPRFAPGQPIPVISLPGMPEDVKGFWSLWRISIQTEDWNRQRIIPIFIHDDGRCLIPTARRVWDLLMAESHLIEEHPQKDNAEQVYSLALKAAESNGRSVFDELVQEHKKRISNEREKGNYAFSTRKKAIERIGLPEVRNYRLSQLAEEELKWRAQLDRKSLVTPELHSLLITRIEGGKT